MPPISRWALIIAASTALTACYRTRDVVPGTVPHTPTILSETPADRQQYFPDSIPSYQIGPQDEISITVFREPDLSLQNVTVDTGGRFEMPLIGQVFAAGKTPEELSREIGARYGNRFLVNPNVSVNVLKINSKHLTVEGALENPGVFSITSKTNLISAIALAGGVNNVAKTSEVAVFRQVGGENLVATFDYSRIRSGEAENPEILPGDIVVVGFSGFKQSFQDFLRFTPIIGVFSRF